MWGLSRDAWVRIICWTVFSIIVILGVRSCSAGSSSSTSSVGNGIWILIFAGLITGAVISRERPYLAFILCGLAALVFLVLLGKFESTFVWAVLGLPSFAALGVYGAFRITGRLQSFLGFASGVLIMFWMFLLYLAHADMIKIGFLGTLFPDDTAKVIFTLALAIFLLATWKRSTIIYLFSLVVFLSFLGNANVNQILDRFPERFTPSVSEKTKQAGKEIGSDLLDWIKQLLKPGTSAPSTPGASSGASRPKFNLNIDLAGTIDMAKSDRAEARIIAGTPAVFIEKDGKVVFEIGHPLPKAEYDLYIDFDLPSDATGYYSLNINGVVYPHIFLVKEGRGKVLTIPQELVKDKNYVSISPQQAMKLKCLWLQEL